MPGLEIGRLGEGELDAAAELLAAAFRDNPLNVAVIGASPRRRLRANRFAMRAQLPVGLVHGELHAARAAGALAAVLVATAPGRWPMPAPALGVRLRSALGQGLRVAARWGEVWERLADHHPPYRHWHLTTLGVAPARQRQGIGSALLAAWLRGLRESPHGVWLETDREANVRLYLRHGFEEADRIRVEGVPVWLMWRAAEAGPDAR